LVLPEAASNDEVRETENPAAEKRALPLCARMPFGQIENVLAALRANGFVICEALVAIQRRVPHISPANRRAVGQGMREPGPATRHEKVKLQRPRMIPASHHEQDSL